MIDSDRDSDSDDSDDRDNGDDSDYGSSDDSDREGKPQRGGYTCSMYDVRHYYCILHYTTQGNYAMPSLRPTALK